MSENASEYQNVSSSECASQQSILQLHQEVAIASSDINFHQHKKWKGMREVNLLLGHTTNLKEEMDKLVKKLDELMDYKIKLILNTKFEHYVAFLIFSIQIEKIINKNIYYLKIDVSGSSVEEYSHMLGSVIGKFTNLYSLDASIEDDFFTDKGSVSLVEGLNKLQNVHVLKFKTKCSQRSYSISSESRRNLRQAIMEMHNLEVFDQNIDQIWQRQHLNLENQNSANDCILNLSSFTYNILNMISMRSNAFNNSKEINEQEKKLKIFEGSIHKYRHRITNLSFDNCQNNNLNDVLTFLKDLTFQQKQLILCFNLPYLTFLEDEIESKKKDKKFFPLLYKFTKEKYLLILLINAFSINVRSSLPFNPLWVVNDLYFD